jgi:hypothetical protein
MRNSATGDKSQDGVIRSFDPAYGASDKYYGWMNIVSWSNLDNRELNLELFPLEGIWVEIKANRYLIPEPAGTTLLGTLKLTEGERHFGDEYNIFARWQQDHYWQWVIMPEIKVLGPGCPNCLKLEALCREVVAESK